MERFNLLETFALVDGGLKNFMSILVRTYWTKQKKMPLKALAAAFKYHLRLYIKTAQYSKRYTDYFK